MLEIDQKSTTDGSVNFEFLHGVPVDLPISLPTEILNDSRARLEAALVAAEIGTWTWEIASDVVRGDTNLNAMFGLLPSPMDGRPIGEYLRAIHPADLPNVSQAIAAVLAPGLDNYYEIECRLIASGCERWVSARGVVERDAEGAAIRLPGVVLDISKQKALEFERARLKEGGERQARVFDTTLSAITDFAYIFDREGRFLYANKALLNLWGLSLEQAVGKNFFDLKYPDALAERLQQQIRQVIDTRQGLSDETPYTSPTGVTGYYEYIFSPVFAPDGSVEVVAGSTRDVSLRKNAEERLRQRTAQFETLLNTAPLGVYLVDADFLIREVNPGAGPVFGNIPNPIGRDFDEVVHILWPQAAADELVRLFRETLETGRSHFAPEIIEERLDTGKTEYYEWRINRIPLPEGRFGVVCYFRDISAQVLARRTLETADRQKNEFLAMLAHELRNPLAPLRNSSELLSRMDFSDPVAQSAAGVIKRQVAQLTRLVDDLLDMARITQGQIELRRRSVEIGSVVTQAIEMVEPLLREKQHAVSVTSSYRPLHVSGDPARLVQCVTNILTNSAKYTDANGAIRVETREEADEVVLTVADNGTGISPELLPRLFDLFVQSDRTLDRAQGGLGIGLAVVKRLVEMHEGRVSAASAGIGCGATFEIRLPLIERPGVAESSVATLKSPARRVLIVDDNVDSATSLAMLLGLDGHEAEATYSGREALARAAVFRPDVVLLDIGLPEMDGYEVARRMRQLSGLSRVRLVALTGYGQSEDRLHALAAGFDDHLVKPVELAALDSALRGQPLA